MQTLGSHRLGVALAALAGALVALPAMAQDRAQASPRTQREPRELTGFVPAGTPLVLDMFDGAATWEALRAFLEPLPRDLPPEVHGALTGLPLLIKAKTGLALDDLLAVFAPGQVLAAWMAGDGDEDPFPVVISRIEEPAEVQRVLRRLGAALAVHVGDRLLTLSDNQRNLARALAFVGSGKPSLLQDRDYTGSRIGLQPGCSLRLFVDMDFFRRRQPRGFLDRLPAAARLAVGPVANLLDVARRLDARLDIQPDRIAVHGRLDGSMAVGKNPVVGRLVRHGAEARTLPPAPQGTVAVLSVDRDLRAFFQHHDKLLSEDASTRVQTFLSQADTFLMGAGLVDGLLPLLELPGAFFVTDTAPEDPDLQPRVKLPALTLAVPLAGDGEASRKAATVVQRALTRAMNVISLAATTDRRRDNRYPVRLMVRRERRGDYQLQYLGWDDWRGKGDPPTDMGFGVTLLFAHDHAVISSTRDGAVRMADAIRSGKGARVRGDYLRLHGAEMARHLARNRDLLVLDRVMKEGESMADARRFWRAALAVLSLLDLEANLAPADRRTVLAATLRRGRK